MDMTRKKRIIRIGMVALTMAITAAHNAHGSLPAGTYDIATNPFISGSDGSQGSTGSHGSSAAARECASWGKPWDGNYCICDDYQCPQPPVSDGSDRYCASPTGDCSKCHPSACPAPQVDCDALKAAAEQLFCDCVGKCENDSSKSCMDNCQSQNGASAAYQKFNNECNPSGNPVLVSCIRTLTPQASINYSVIASSRPGSETGASTSISGQGGTCGPTGPDACGSIAAGGQTPCCHFDPSRGACSTVCVDNSVAPTPPIAPVSSANSAACDQLVTTLYQNCLGRNPDPGGLQGYSSACQSGMSTAAIENALLASAECQSKPVICNVHSCTPNSSQGSAGGTTVPAPAGSFDKHGNNGTVSCDTFCNGSQWGQAGVCVPVKSACDQVPGFIASGAEWPCTCMPGQVASPAAPTTPAPSAPFTKHGNNGTVSCGTFCSGSQWGQVGTCAGGQLATVACGQTVGYIDNGQEITCTCNDNGKTYTKHGNNGTVSCDTFCQGAGWGEAGSCVSASMAQVPCDLTPGYLNGNELTCNCQ